MTQEEILDYNKRCAEFLGYNDTVSDNDFYFATKKEYDINSSVPKMLELNFEKRFINDWNWIMEVVEAIEKLKFRFEIWKLEDANLHRVDILKMGWDSTSVFDAKDGWSKLTYPSKKEAVVEAINQFLIWYNENKEK